MGLATVVTIAQPYCSILGGNENKKWSFFFLISFLIVFVQK